jgi:hypothetical protein
LPAPIFTYAAPFYLKRILDALDEKPPTRAPAFVYAMLAFAAALLKAETNLQHLWFGRRAAMRIRSKLVAMIYDKALKRGDYSGIVNEEKERRERRR